MPNTTGAPAPASTLENLQAAFQGESNARVRYLAFAEKADQEGYCAVAALFRAAVRAEEIHAYNHATVIRKMGATPQAEIETPAVKSTRENLEVAIRGEVYERDVMYPTFLDQARAEANQGPAVRTFHLAQRAEAEHARLFTEALDRLETMRDPTQVYYVCPVCGYTSPAPEHERCPICAAMRSSFEEIV